MSRKKLQGLHRDFKGRYPFTAATSVSQGRPENLQLPSGHDFARLPKWPTKHQATWYFETEGDRDEFLRLRERDRAAPNRPGGRL